MVFLTSIIFIYVFLFTFNKGHCNDNEEFPPEGEKKVVIGPSQTLTLWVELDKDIEELTLHKQPLPDSIEDLRAFTYDTLRTTFIFSGGDPNKLISYNKELHKLDIVVDDVIEATSMDTDQSENPPIMHSPYIQTKKVLGKVFTFREEFSGENSQSVLLGHNPATGALIFAAWDGKLVTIEIKDGNTGNLNGLEIKGDRKHDVIYVSNQDGVAVVVV